MLRFLVVSVCRVPISALLPMPVPDWLTCVIFRARSLMNQSKSSFVVMASSIRWLLRPTLLFPMFSTVRRSLWPRTCRLQFASPVMMVCGIKASLTSSRCAVCLVIALKTVLLMVSDVVAVSLGMWLAIVPPANCLLLPLLLIPFLLFLHASDFVSASGADPSMSADEERPGFLWHFHLWVWFLFWWQRVLSLVPTSVLVSTVPGSVLHASASPPQPSRVALESSTEFPVDPAGQRAWWAAESIWFSFSRAVS